MKLTHGLVQGGHWIGSSVLYVSLDGTTPVEEFVTTLREALANIETKQPLGLYFRHDDYLSEHLSKIMDKLRMAYPNLQIIVEVGPFDEPKPFWNSVNWIILVNVSPTATIPAGVHEVQYTWTPEAGDVQYLPRRLWGHILLYVRPVERGMLNQLFTWVNRQLVPIKVIPASGGRV